MRLSIIIFLATIFISCDNDVIGVNDTDVIEDFEGSELIPMAVGNSWDYESIFYDDNGDIIDEKSLEWLITNTHEFDGVDWFRIQSSDYPNENVYYLLENKGLSSILLGRFENEPILTYNLKSKIGDVNQYIFFDFDLSTETENSSTFMGEYLGLEVNGQEYRCLQYNTNKTSNLKTELQIDYFSPGIGLVKREIRNPILNIIIREDILISHNIENLEDT